MIVNLLLALAGLALCFVGTWLIYPPAALVGLGLALIVLGFLREAPDGKAGR